MEATSDNETVIGVDLGGTKLLAGRFGPGGVEQERLQVPVAGLDLDAVIDALVGAVQQLMAGSSQQVSRVGFGIPATIDQRTGNVVVAANLPLVDLPLRSILEQRLGTQVCIDNDANVAALAEQRLGAGAGVTRDLVMITLGTGFGGGVIIDGRIMRGAIGAGAELGHMSIDHDGPRCIAPNCPGIGCIETFVGGQALARDAREHVELHRESALARAVADGAPARGETVLRLALDGDPGCRELLERMGKHFGVAMASLVNIFNPGVIAVGGGMMPALEFMLPVARRVLVERALPPGNEFVQVVPATFGPDAGMVGASLLARDGIGGAGT